MAHLSDYRAPLCKVAVAPWLFRSRLKVKGGLCPQPLTVGVEALFGALLIFDAVKAK